VREAQEPIRAVLLGISLLRYVIRFLTEKPEYLVAKTLDHVRGYPDTFVIDARGVIRHQHLLGSGLDKAVDELIKEAETPVAGK